MANTSPWLIARAHGDLAIHNMFQADGQPWIFDWEESVDDAPRLTDRLAFELSKALRPIVRSPRSWRTILDRRAPALGSMPRHELMQALTFRYQQQMQDARIIVKNWDQSSGWGKE
jgi:hypothetical protein